MAPFEIVEGGKKVLPMLQTKDKIFEADKYVQNVDEAFRKIKITLEKTQFKQKKAVDRHRRELVFSLGDWDEGLGKRLAHGYPYLEAEVAYCARNEYCETAVDFIARRSRLAFLDTKAAAKAIPRVVEILACEHKWDKPRKKLELRRASEFLKTFKASENARFDDGKRL
ncbi:hypothetical protein L7F22_022108 [Adiantum nelumboides]|nr:hypothetical protein [Adiantum nelumboides]